MTTNIYNAASTNNLKIPGLLYFLAGAIVLMGIITSEAFYPSGYSTFNNEISDLGATRQPNSVSFYPSSIIFNTVMWLAGILILIASFYQYKHFKKLLFTIPVVLFGLGLIGVGIFPGNVRPYHGMASMLTFISGGFCVLTSFKVVSSPFKYISILFGSITLLTYIIAVFASDLLISHIGIGGIERWVAYPIMLWLTGFGGYLMNTNQEKL
jgi:hypothetical membrane protein